MNDYSVENFNNLLEKTGEIGFVDAISDPLIYVTGLPTASLREVVLFESGQLGQVLALSDGIVEVLLLSRDLMGIGTRVVRTQERLQIPVGEVLLGNIIDPLGHSLREESPIYTAESRPVDSLAPDISARERVREPFFTGVTVVDLMVPLGKGQRELVIGDRKTGKMDFLKQTLLCQSKVGTVCIYACIGKKRSTIRSLEEFISKNNISGSTIVVASSSLDPLGLIYLTPYSAMALAEYFRDSGHDVLLILDDLTTHAQFYREIALIGRRFPGRDAYPGDIFYIHSRLLERAGNFKTEKGTRSITCLPVAETVEGDISGYIPTNLMSITDGHVFFDKELFSQGRRPAVNYFLSVTRVGRQTQSKIRWGINRELSTLLTLLEKTQQFVHFGAEISEGVRTTLETGNRILSFFTQPMGYVVAANVQSMLFVLIWLGMVKSEAVESGVTYVVQKAANLYEADATFKGLVDNFVGKAADLNDILNKMTDKTPEILSYLKEPNADGKKD